MEWGEIKGKNWPRSAWRSPKAISAGSGDPRRTPCWLHSTGLGLVAVGPAVPAGCRVRSASHVSAPHSRPYGAENREVIYRPRLGAGTDFFCRAAANDGEMGCPERLRRWRAGPKTRISMLARLGKTQTPRYLRYFLRVLRGLRGEHCPRLSRVPETISPRSPRRTRRSGSTMPATRPGLQARTTSGSLFLHPPRLKARARS